MAAYGTDQKRSGGCGCGGSSSSSLPCTCGGSCGGTCAICQGESYTRPRFFAGQLLTEDDLQQLNNYVVAKNRLHASHLFGSGVVCGLEVTCHPCGGGKVLVNPGYALDCCGNDIVVACPQELDINQLVRDLQRRMRGGFDCGDPCAETTAGTTKSPSGQPAPGKAGNAAARKESEEGRKVSDCQKYCLYIDYCEQSTDPVAPYATDDPCGPTGCETTRTREGFRFELRCPDPTEPTPEICSRFWDCMGGKTAYEGFRPAASFLRRSGEEIVAAYHAIQEFRIPKSPDKFIASLKASVESASSAIEAFHAAQERKKRSQTLIPLPVAQDVVKASQRLGSDLAIYATLDAEERRKIDKHIEEEKDEILKVAAGQLASISQILNQILKDPDLKNLLATDLEKAHGISLAEVIDRLSNLLPGGGKKAAEFHAEEAAGFPPTTGALTRDLPIRFLAAGAVVGKALYNEMVRNADSLLAWLVYRLEQQSMKTSCDLLDSLLSLPTLSPATTPDIRADAYFASGRVGSTVGRVFWELLRTCICNVLNPPCPSCDDPGVLLACLTVEQCKVKDICNLERQFVLSPVALRYWVLQITSLGEAVEKFCCPDPCAQKTDYGLADRQDTRYTAATSDADYSWLILQLFVSSCWEKEKSRTRVAKLLLAASSAEAPGPFAPADIGRPAPMSPPEAMSTAGAEGPSEPDMSTKLMRVRLETEKLRADYARLLDRLSRLEKKRGLDSREGHE